MWPTVFVSRPCICPPRNLLKRKKKVLIQTENDPNSAESKAWFHGLEVDFLQAFKKRKGLEMTSYKENKLFYDIICKTKTLWNIVSISILFVPLGQIYWIIITIMRMKKNWLSLLIKGKTFHETVHLRQSKWDYSKYLKCKLAIWPGYCIQYHNKWNSTTDRSFMTRNNDVT